LDFGEFGKILGMKWSNFRRFCEELRVMVIDGGFKIAASGKKTGGNSGKSVKIGSEKMAKVP